MPQLQELTDFDWTGIGMPDLSPKAKKTEVLNPLVTRVKVFNGEKHLNVPISLDWTINCFKMEAKLKHFLKQQGISTLVEFMEKYDNLYFFCPERTKLELENFNKMINRVILEKIYPKETYHRIKKIHTNNNKKPNVLQRAFMNALYFFENIFRKFEEFKDYIKKKADELNIRLNPNWV